MEHPIRLLFLGLSSSLLALTLNSYAATQSTEPATDATPQLVIENSQELIATQQDTVREDFGGLLGSWTLLALDGTMPKIEHSPPTLEVMPDGTVAGFSGINHYRATMTTDLPPERVKFVLGASTMMAGPEDVMATEQTFLERLGAVSTFTIEGDILRMYAGDNEALTFTRANN